MWTHGDEPDGPPNPPKKYNKFLFRSICNSLDIINEKHYQNCLKDVVDLQECEICMNLSQLESYKKLIFVHNFRRLLATYKIPRMYELQEKNRLGICCRFLKTIAIENSCTFNSLIDLLTR